MAGYQSNAQRNTRSTPSVAGKASNGGRKAALFSTGLFAPTKEGVKSIGSVQVKEEIVIPAGSYINLYDNTADRKSDTSPSFRLQVTEGKLKAAGK